MLVRTFKAGEMSEALRMVKAEMGLDAMILSSKKEKRKGILGFFSKPYFEVTAALEPRAPSRPNPYREEPAPVLPARELSTKEEFQNSMLGPLAREVRDLKVRIEALSRKDAQAAAGPAVTSEPASEPEQGPRTFAKEELEEIKKLLYSAVSGKEKQLPKPVSFPQADAPAQQAAAAQPDAELLREQLSRLQVPLALAPLAQSAKVQEPHPVQEPTRAPEPQSRETQPQGSQFQELQIALTREQPEQEHSHLELLARELRAEELSPEVVELLMQQLRPAAEDGAELEELRGLLGETLASLVKCSGSLRMKKNGPRIMAIVGPTGVGKTTTLAKLAAMHALNRGASVAMVTTDNFRVGAIEQLKTYAKIMDIPLEVAATSQELAKVLARHSDKDLILIDTAGRSHKDAERLEELKGYLQCYPGIETYLCMSATTRARELDEIVATFGVLPISRFLFTKLDESESFGCIVNTHIKHKLPISYFTTGQKVPEDIEVATSRKLAALVVKESTR
jgi:flagellar biosynthesis protein FlhF